MTTRENKNYIRRQKAIFFGTLKGTKEKIFLTLPEWQCGWYWAFGWMGNRDCHYHLDGYQRKDHFFTLKDGSHKLITEKRNLCMHDALLTDYDLAPQIKENLWAFCDLVLSAYTLKKAAEVLGRGGSHMTSNPPAKDFVLDEEMTDKINNEKLPAIFKALEEILLSAESIHPDK